MSTNRFRAHFCFWDKGCRSYGAPRRLYLFSPFGMMMIGARSQVWLPGKGYTQWWFPITYSPPHRRGRVDTLHVEP